MISSSTSKNRTGHAKCFFFFWGKKCDHAQSYVQNKLLEASVQITVLHAQIISIFLEIVYLIKYAEYEP